MNKDEFNAWVSKNVGKGGSRPRIDLFNKSHKGKERNPTAAEYPCKDIPEYHRYSEYWKFKEEDEDKKQEDKRDNNDDKSRSSKASQNAGNIAKNVVKNIVPKVVAVVAGAVITVVSYNDLKAKEAQAAVLKTEWVWSEDYSSATLSLYNQNNLLVKTRDGVITVIENPASCTEGGDKTYTATAKDQDKTYTDSRNVILDPLGHDFDEGVKSIVDGNPTITYECLRCHEHFSITVEEEDAYPDYLAAFHWSEDHSSCEVELTNMDGSPYKTVPAEINVSTIEPGCTTTGETIYTASVTEGWTVYKDKVVEVLPALGHQFGEGVESIVDGKPTITYTCNRCGETFSITIDTGEEEGLGLHNEEHHHIHHEHLTEWCEHCEHHHHLD